MTNRRVPPLKRLVLADRQLLQPTNSKSASMFDTFLIEGFRGAKVSD